MSNELQKYVKGDYDTRTLPEIWESLPEPVRIDVRDEIIKRLGCSRITVHYWSKGKCRPQYMGSRRVVSQAILKVTGIKTHPYILFPEQP